VRSTYPNYLQQPEMSKKLITILLLVINVISLKSEINEAIQTNSFVNVTGKGSDVESNFMNLFFNLMPDINFQKHTMFQIFLITKGKQRM
jgi:hypothetical protein